LQEVDPSSSEKLPVLQKLQGKPSFSSPSALKVPFGQKASQAIDEFAPWDFVKRVYGNAGERTINWE